MHKDTDQDLIEALTQEGIEPTPEAIAQLDLQVTMLAECLVAWYLAKAGTENSKSANCKGEECLEFP